MQPAVIEAPAFGTVVHRTPDFDMQPAVIEVPASRIFGNPYLQPTSADSGKDKKTIIVRMQFRFNPVPTELPFPNAAKLLMGYLEEAADALIRLARGKLDQLAVAALSELFGGAKFPDVRLIQFAVRWLKEAIRCLAAGELLFPAAIHALKQAEVWFNQADYQIARYLGDIVVGGERGELALKAVVILSALTVSFGTGTALAGASLAVVKAAAVTGLYAMAQETAGQLSLYGHQLYMDVDWTKIPKKGLEEFLFKLAGGAIGGKLLGGVAGKIAGKFPEKLEKTLLDVFCPAIKKRFAMWLGGMTPLTAAGAYAHWGPEAAKKVVEEEFAEILAKVFEMTAHDWADELRREMGGKKTSVLPMVEAFAKVVFDKYWQGPSIEYLKSKGYQFK